MLTLTLALPRIPLLVPRTMPDPSKPNLTILSGPQSGTSYEMDSVDNLLIGSDSSCPFFIDAPGISPIHARIWLDAEGCTVFDTHSPTGIYINDDRVVEKAPLRNGDILWLGSPGDETSVMIQVSLPGSGVELAKPAILNEEAPPAEVLEMASEAETIVAQPTAHQEAQAALSAPDPVEVIESADVLEMAPSPPIEEAPAEEAPAEPPLVAESEPAPQTLKSFTFDDADAEPEPETVVEAAPPTADSGFEFEEPPAEAVPETVAMAAPETFEFAESSEPPPLPVEPVVEASPETQAVAFIHDEPEPETLMVPPSAPEPAQETMASESPAFFTEEPPVVAPPSEEPAFFTEEPATIAAAPAAPIEDEFVVDEPPPSAPPPPPVAAPAPPPKPIEAKPAAPKPEVKKADTTMRRPGTPAAAPKAAPASRPPSRPAPRGGAGPSPVVLGGIGAVVLVVVAGGAWFVMGKKTPPPPPSTVAGVTTLPPPDVTAPAEVSTPAPPPVEEVVTVPTQPPVTVAAAIPTPPAVTVAAKPTPSPKATPSTAGKATPPPVTTPAQPTAAQLAGQVAAQVQTALGKADASVTARNYAEAVQHFDEALKLEPGNAKATSGKAAANAALASLRKAFVAGKTSFIGKAKKGPAGFDDNEPADPDYQGRVDYEFSPPNVKPGDAYTAKVYLANEGKKPIKIGGVTVATVTNGQRAANPASGPAKEVAPGQRGLLADVSGTWKEGTNNWSLDVVVTSGRGETYTSRANWR